MADMPELKVAVERVAMNALAEVVQKIVDEFGIVVNAASFEWIETTNAGSKKREARCIGARVDMQIDPTVPV